MKQKVIKIIQNIIAENDLKGNNYEKISEATVLTDHLGFDSFNLAQLTVEIESEFGVDIFEKTSIIKTLGDILKQLA